LENKLEVRYTPDSESYKKLNSDELRKYFLIDNLFKPGEIGLIYTDVDRAIIGTAIPVKNSLKLMGSKKELASEYFAERREIGIINIGGSGKIKADKNDYLLKNKEALYIGRGTKEIEFFSEDASLPAKFYLISYPAHKELPCKQIKFNEAESINLGQQENSNKRTIHKFILPSKMETCQLVMGLTELEPGNVWNTLPPHSHQRRTEIYMYFNLKEDSVVFHLMGEARETRHLVIRNQQVVISPSYSIHSGVGSQNYSFIWAMGGENQEFDDMDWISINEIQ
jgi:4-deoxy-L-threo-5-hexosulose-uronate ketol-isomerase